MEWVESASGRRIAAEGDKERMDDPDQSRLIPRGEKLVPRILVIDDEQLLGQTIQLGLEDSMRVELETSGEEGLARLLATDQEKIDLVLCDLSLPDISGIEIYRRIQQENPGILERFVVMTGGAVSTESREFLDRYRGPLLNKPFTLSQVESLVDGLLQKSA